MTPAYPPMPDLSHGFHGFHHTLDSALAILSDLHIPAARVNIRMAGRGYPTRWVVEQNPPAGSDLHPGATVSLDIAGTGFFHALPVGMWDQGGEAEPGTREIVELLDDPLEKAGHWLREGARLFDIQAGDPRACARWMGLFGLVPEDWPQELWYRLALLLPNLQSLAGKEFGIRFALDLLLGLPLREIRRAPMFQYFGEDQLSRLGGNFGRLGVDLVVGAKAEDLARLTLVVGPVELDAYYEFLEPEKKNLLQAVLDLVCSSYQTRAVQWLVLDAAKPPRLGMERDNSRLGINSYLGAGRPAALAAEA